MLDMLKTITTFVLIVKIMVARVIRDISMQACVFCRFLKGLACHASLNLGLLTPSNSGFIKAFQLQESRRQMWLPQAGWHKKANVNDVDRDMRPHTHTQDKQNRKGALGGKQQTIR